MTASPTSSGVPPPKYITRKKASKRRVIGWTPLRYDANRAADCDAPWAMSLRTSSPSMGSSPPPARSGATRSAICV